MKQHIIFISKNDLKDALFYKWPCSYLVAGEGFGSEGSYRAAGWRGAGSAAAGWSSGGGGLRSSNMWTSGRDDSHEFKDWITHQQSHLNAFHSDR